MFRNNGRNANANVRPPVGSFTDCAKCETQFTVVCFQSPLYLQFFIYFSVQTRYTAPANPPPGFLCHECKIADGSDPFKKPAARKRKAPEEKRKAITLDERRLPSLTSLCIKVRRLPNILLRLLS